MTISEPSPRPDPAPAPPLPSSVGAAVLLTLVVLAFGASLSYGLISWDDYDNLSENPHLTRFGWRELGWAFTTSHLGVYQPLAWISLGLQWRLFQGHAGALHFVGIVLHAVQSLLLWRLYDMLLARLRPGTPARLRQLCSWTAAALFAVHPLRTEAVVWVSCQPYLPSVVFFTLSLIAYLRAQEEERPAEGRRRQLRLAVLHFLLAVLFKAVALTLPVVLVILDVLLLGRLGGRRGWRAPGVWKEKLPFLVISAAATGLAVWAKRDVQSLVPLEAAGLSTRLAQAAHGFWFYLGKTIFPWPLHAYYVLPRRPNLEQASYLQGFVAATIALVVVVLLRRRLPWLAAAVGSYLVILLPNLGLVTFGAQLTADRYSYLSSLPLMALPAGLLAWLSLHRPYWQRPLTAAVAVVLIGLVALSWRQTTTWRDPVTLWSHVLRYGGRNWISHTNFGQALGERGRKDEAFRQFEAAYRLAPHESITNANLATELAERGRMDEAMKLFQESVRLEPNVPAYFGLGTNLDKLGRTEEAAAAFRQAIGLRRNHADTLTNLAVLELRRGRTAEGAALLEQALAASPDHPVAHFNRGLLRFSQGDVDGAIAEYRWALKVRPSLAVASRALEEALAARSARASGSAPVLRPAPTPRP